MHLSMHNWMRAEPLEVTVRRLAYGYESIEISGEPDSTTPAKCAGPEGERHPLLGRDDADARRPQPRAGEEGPAESVQYVKDCVTMVEELEGHEVTIVPGEVGKVVPASTPEAEWGWAVDGMKEIYDYAQKAGVRLAVEPLNRFETYFVSRADQALALAKATGPEVGVCLDTFHLNIEEPTPSRRSRVPATGWWTSTSPTPTGWRVGWAAGTGPGGRDR